MKRRHLMLLVGALLVQPALRAGAQNTPAPQQVAVTIRDHTFVPAVVHVRPGEPIVWTNADQDAHTVTSGSDNVDDGRWKSSPLIADGQTFTLRLNEPGTYRYFCLPHQFQASMHGTIIVER